MNVIFYHDSNQANTQKMSCSLILKNKMDEISRLSEWINNDIPDLFNISEKAVFKIDLILTELIVNIVSYAYPTQCESNIEIKFHRMADKIRIDIEDNGIPFNPLEAPDIVLPQSLDEADIGGLGIHLIRHYMDEGNYQRKDNKNIFTVQLSV